MKIKFGTDKRISRELRGLREWGAKKFLMRPIRVIRVIRG